MPELSIIVPIYNGEKYLRKCIDSILAQDFKDFEVILVDDGSSDNSLDICREFEQKDDRVVVFHKQNAGLVAARKSGVSLARGNYIGFVDCDDYIDSNMYSKLMSAAQNNQVDIVISNIVIERENSSTALRNMILEGVYGRDRIANEIMPHLLVHSGFIRFGIIPGVVLKVFDRNVLSKALESISDRVTIGEDAAITAHCINLANKIVIMDLSAYHYVQHDKSMSRNIDLQTPEDLCQLYNCIAQIDSLTYHGQANKYLSWLIFGTVSRHISNSHSDSSSISDRLNQILYNNQLAEILKSTPLDGLSFKNRIKIMLMRHRMTALLTFFVKRANK